VVSKYKRRKIFNYLLKKECLPEKPEFDQYFFLKSRFYNLKFTRIPEFWGVYFSTIICDL